MYHKYLVTLRGIHTLPGEVTHSKLFVPFWKEVYSKKKEFAPFGSKFLLFRVDTFSEGANSFFFE